MDKYHMNIKYFMYGGLLVAGALLGGLGMVLTHYFFLTDITAPSRLIIQPQTQTVPTDKPFLLGFTSLGQEYSIKKLAIKGTIPTWLRGTFIAIGPGKFEVNGNRASHWLDGFAMIHRFAITHGNISYANKLVNSQYYQDSIKKGTILGTTPNAKESSWSKLKSALSSKEGDQPVYDNVNINILPFKDKVLACTETPHSVCIDCETLETKNEFTFNDKVGGHFSSAHPLYDPETKEWYNFTTQFAHNSNYILYKMVDSDPKRIPITSIQVGYPSYMHSFALTKKYVVLTEMPFTVSPYDLLLGKKSFLESHTWNPKKGAHFTIIDRTTGKIVGKYKTHAFFALHHVNAFDTDNGVAVDIVTYKDPRILQALSFSHLHTNAIHNFPSGTLERFDINLNTQSVHARVLSKQNIELPHINHRASSMLPYTYVYGTSMSSSTHFSDQLVKINTKNGKVTVWQEAGCYTTEPIFVPAPQASTEDAGVLISIILDSKKEQSFLLILDAQTMKELGRALVPHHIPFTVHSKFLLPSK